MSARSGFAVCVGGVPGAGKTTLLRTHVERERRDRQVTGSSVVKGIIAPSTVQDLDAWPLERRVAVREQSIHALRRLAAACDGGRLLVDGHFTLRNRTSGIVEPVFTPEDEAFFAALVLVDPLPEAVLEQRIADGKHRESESLEAISEHLGIERAEGRRLAASMGVPWLELTTSDGEQRLAELVAFLDHVAPLGGAR